MSSNEIPTPIFNDGDLDESDDDTYEEEDHNDADSTPHPPSQQPRNLNDVLDEEEEDDAIDLDNGDDAIDLDNGNDEDDGFNSDPSLVTIAVPPPSEFPNSDLKHQPNPNHQLYQEEEKKIPIQQQQQPLDDSRKLFQRLWTDEDEIELLQGFLEYMTQRGISYHNHHDLGLFYEQIKSKLQLDFNKNQLVEKLRRLKRKYRNVLNRTIAGKEISFKSPHDQATYEISSKIWSDLSSSKDGGAGGGGVGVGIGIDDEETIPVPVPVPNLSPNPSYNFFNHNATLANANANANANQNVHYAHLNGVFDGKLPSHSSKKRSRVKMEEKGVLEERIRMPNSGQGQSSSVALGPGIQGLIEETVKKCLPALMKETLNNEGNGLCGGKGFGVLSSGVGMLSELSPLGLNFGSPSNLLGGEASQRKWKKQQIMELEVYSKRLELVQEQIKVTLQELRSGNHQH